MRMLRYGYRPAIRRAGAVIGAALVALPMASASAEPIGGSLLDRPTVTVLPSPEAHPLPKVKAATWVLADAETGQILAAKGAHVRRAPASTLKMLTALAVMPDTSPEDTWVATKKAAYTYGARVGLRPGKTYTLDDLWQAVFLHSANDAAIAVAQAHGGVQSTIHRMNELAHQLQASDTTAKTPNGLDAPGQYSSAYDLALIGRAGMQREDFAHYAGMARGSFPNIKGKGRHTLYTTNRLLLHGWKGMVGVKTGFTTHAGRTYVGAATRHGRTLIVAMMGISESTEWAAKKLLKWGFHNADAVQPVGVLVDPLPEVAPTAPAATPPTAAAADTAPATGEPVASGPLASTGSLPAVAIAAAASATALVAGGFMVWRRRRSGSSAEAE